MRPTQARGGAPAAPRLLLNEASGSVQARSALTSSAVTAFTAEASPPSSPAL